MLGLAAMIAGNNMIKEILHEGKLLAIVVWHDFAYNGIHFVTPNDFSQQLAFMKHPKGRIITPHTHIPVTREVRYTKEVLLIKKGSIRVDFYDDSRSYLESVILGAGDVILLAEGGHGFEVLQDLEMIEVKQGPYAGEADKIRFGGINSTTDLRFRSSGE